MKKILAAVLALALGASALAATKVAVEQFKVGERVFVVDEVGSISTGIVGESVFGSEAEAEAYAQMLDGMAEEAE